MLNAEAVAERALGLAAELDRPIAVACAGRHKATIPCLDDTYAAGVIVERATGAAERLGLELELTDAAKIGLALCREAGPPVRALRQSATAAVLRRVHGEADIDFCARPDAMPIVPVVDPEGAVERYPVILV